MEINGLTLLMCIVIAFVLCTIDEIITNNKKAIREWFRQKIHWYYDE